MSASLSKKSRALSRVACLLLVPAALVGACGEADDDQESANPPASGSAGMPGAGTSTAGGDGRAGAGGATASRGGQGNAGESSGVAGAGASGGEPSSGGSAGSSDPGAAGAGALDDCFEGMRASVGNFQDGVKTSADMSYRMRIALETADRFGTSGTMPWLPIRLALQTPEETLCITDEALLAAGFTSTHHNCSDALTFTQGERVFTITNPDSAIDYVDPTTWMRPSMLTVAEGGNTVAGPIRLDTIECTSPDDQEGACRSGGPCL